MAFKRFGEKNSDIICNPKHLVGKIRKLISKIPNKISFKFNHSDACWSKSNYPEKIKQEIEFLKDQWSLSNNMDKIVQEGLIGGHGSIKINDHSSCTFDISIADVGEFETIFWNSDKQEWYSK